jgi:hypothetical protein
VGSSNIIVDGINSNGVPIGIVYNGSNYFYSASGRINFACGYSCDVDPNGKNPDGILIDCDANHGSTNGTDVTRCPFPCPAAICYSLVGKIE